MILLKLFAKKNLSEPRFLLPLSFFCPCLLPAVCYQIFFKLCLLTAIKSNSKSCFIFIKPLLEMPKCLCEWEGGSAKGGSNQERLLLMLCELSGAFFCAKLFSGSLKGRCRILGSKWSGEFHSPACLCLVSYWLNATYLCTDIKGISLTFAEGQMLWGLDIMLGRKNWDPKRSWLARATV